MHVYMKQQLAEDRVAELRADAQRAGTSAYAAPSGPPGPIRP